ncbi:hypothetical protein TSUD_252120 [Trifolium subterraneum]|uniref:23 kDa subunit of oxygen evolving system of photosystem II n=1 Tax=Trifolium subterraneum TaxID=3900 RepID=A0A2Z6LSA8_TRISU|nr:hypothetical protein TSUD_252120 [Trifolium subterraneum]
MASSVQCFLSHPALTKNTKFSSQRHKPNKFLVCRAQNQKHAIQEDDDCSSSIVSRRLALTVLIGAAAVGSKVSPADAAYGQSANVFGKPKTNTDFLPYNGDGFKLSVPSKWNPSKEVEYTGQVVRYEDNFDTTSNVVVTVNYLLGKQAFFGETQAEGGFDPNAVATANILESSTPVIDGKKYYVLSVLTRTADGDEGGKHQIIRATVKDGKLYICKAQAGDKRWFKGARRYVESTANSFSVA